MCAGSSTGCRDGGAGAGERLGDRAGRYACAVVKAGKSRWGQAPDGGVVREPAVLRGGWRAPGGGVQVRVLEPASNDRLARGHQPWTGYGFVRIGQVLRRCRRGRRGVRLQRQALVCLERASGRGAGVREPHVLRRPGRQRLGALLPRLSLVGPSACTERRRSGGPLMSVGGLLHGAGHHDQSGVPPGERTLGPCRDDSGFVPARRLRAQRCKRRFLLGA